MKRKITSESYISKEDILNDLEFDSNELPSLKLRCDLYSKLIDVIEKEKLKPKQLEKIFDEQQPRISNLLSGKVSKFSSEKLVEYLAKLGADTKPVIRFKNRKKHIEKLKKIA